MEAQLASKKNVNPSNNVRANVIINLIRTLTMTVLSFITFPYVCRILGDSTLGLYTWCNTFVYYFLILAKISIPNIAIRECMKVRDDKAAFSHLVQMFYLLQAIMTLVSFALMASIVLSLPIFTDSQTTSQLVFLLSINFLAGAFSFEWVYITLEKHFYITVRSITLLALSAALTFVFLTGMSDPVQEIFIYGFITILSTVLTSLINCMILPRYVSFKKTGPYDFRSVLKPIFALFLISVALTLYNQTDVFLLGIINSEKNSVGAYSVGVKGVDIIIGIITSLYAVFMPRANYYYQKENKVFFQNLVSYSMNITFFIAIPAIATMAAMAKPITALISGNYGAASNSYQDADLALVILSIMMLTYSIADNIYTEILLPSKKEKYYLYTLLLGLILNVGLSLLFALVFFVDRPVVGVAIATALSDVIILIFLLYMSRQYSKKAIFNLNNIKIIALGIVIGVFTYFVGPLLLNALPWSGEQIWISYVLELVIMVGIDAIIYVVGLLLLKEHLVSSFLPGHKKEAEKNA